MWICREEWVKILIHFLLFPFFQCGEGLAVMTGSTSIRATLPGLPWDDKVRGRKLTNNITQFEKSAYHKEK